MPDMVMWQMRLGAIGSDPENQWVLHRFVKACKVKSPLRENEESLGAILHT